MTNQPLTQQQLDEIEGRAAALYEYATVMESEGQAALDELTDKDVPALLGDLKRARAQVRFLLDQIRRKDARSGDGDKALREFLAGGEEASTPASGADTLPAWLHWRFGPHGQPWSDVPAEDQACWEHQARAVRRAVARGGFKPRPAASAVSGAADSRQP